MLSIRNVCLIYDTASLYALQDLIAACRIFMDKYATDILSQESFLSLSSVGIREIISRDSFCAPEVKVLMTLKPAFLMITLFKTVRSII
jgi:BTB/POZ domain-containing protein 9